MAVRHVGLFEIGAGPFEDPVASAQVGVIREGPDLN